MLRKAIKEIFKEYEAILQGQIEAELDLAPTGQRGTRNNTDRLRAFGGKESIIKAIKVSTSSNGFLTEVNKPYAPIHEYGGKIKQKVSSKQKGYFFAKYYQTKEDVWKAMALSEFLTIRIKARPYLRPALERFQDEDLEDLLDDIMEAAADEFG
jgi:phage gpG-like protein